MIRILFDQGVPVPLRDYLSDHNVETCYEKGWSAYSNGDLITKADAHFDVFITTDKNLRYQQNLTHRKIAILVLPTTRWPLLKPHELEFAKIVSNMEEGAFYEWQLPE